MQHDDNDGRDPVAEEVVLHAEHDEHAERHEEQAPDVHAEQEEVLAAEAEHVGALQVLGDARVDGARLHDPARRAHVEAVVLVGHVVEDLPAVRELLRVEQEDVHGELEGDDDEAEGDQ